MKKILSIVLMGLLMISSAGVRINADDSNPSTEGPCEVSRPLVTNLRIEDGMLEWDEGEGAENEEYEIRITDMVTTVEDSTTETYFDVLEAIETKMGQGSHSGVNFTVPGLYYFDVYTVGNDCNEKTPVEMSAWSSILV